MYNPCKCGHGEVIHDYEVISRDERESTYCRYPKCDCVHYVPMSAGIIMEEAIPIHMPDRIITNLKLTT
jgi:hypothetical protein